MKSIDGLLDDIKKKHGLTSDYKLALFLGIGAGNIANYRHDRSMPSPAACEKIAAALGLDADVLTAHFEAQRAKDDATRAIWNRIANRLQMGAANVEICILLAIFLIASYAPPVQAIVNSTIGGFGQSVYYVK